MIRAILLTSALAATAMTISAQDLSTEITVEAGVETGLPEASPAPTIYPEAPALQAPSLHLRPMQYTEASAFPPSAGDITTPLYTGIPAPEHYRGHAWAGYFPVWNITAGATYRLWEHGNSSIGIGGRFDGARYGYSGQYDNTFRVGASGRHQFGSTGPSLHVSADYLHSWLGYGQILGGSDMNPGINHADIRATLRGSKAVEWHATVKYVMTSVTEAIIETPTDHRLTIEGLIRRPLRRKDTSFDLGAAIDLLNTHGTGITSEGTAYTPTRHTSMLVTLSPAVRFTIGRHILAKAGVRLDVGINTAHRAINIAPDIYLGWRPAPVFEAYLTAGGGERYFTIADQYRMSPFYTGSALSDAIYTPIDARLGLNLHPVSGLAIALYGGYSATRHMPMMMLGYYPYAMVATDISGWNAGLHATYTYRRLLDARAEVRLYPHGYPGRACADVPDRAKIAINTGVAVHPTARWDISLDYEFRGGRRAYWVYPMEGWSGLGAVSDLSMAAHYHLQPNLTIFARLANMTARTWAVTHMVGCRPFHGLVGVHFRF